MKIIRLKPQSGAFLWLSFYNYRNYYTPHKNYTMMGKYILKLDIKGERNYFSIGQKE